MKFCIFNHSTTVDYSFSETFVKATISQKNQPQIITYFQLEDDFIYEISYDNDETADFFSFEQLIFLDKYTQQLMERLYGV